MMIAFLVKPSLMITSSQSISRSHIFLSSSHFTRENYIFLSHDWVLIYIHTTTTIYDELYVCTNHYLRYLIKHSQSDLFSSKHWFMVKKKLFQFGGVDQYITTLVRKYQAYVLVRLSKYHSPGRIWLIKPYVSGDPHVPCLSKCSNKEKSV